MAAEIALVKSARPSWIRRGLTSNWLWLILFFGFPVSAGIIWLTRVRPAQEYSLWELWLGAFVGVVIGFPVFYVVQYLVGRLNGAPFHRGDCVQILSSRHCGKIVRVYDEWPERGQVRVDLGDDLKRDVEDVFSYVELRRVNQRQRPCGE